MIVIRDVFHLHFGKARQATELLERGAEELRSAGYPVDRILVDMTGEYYRIVMESRAESLAQFEQGLKEATAREGWRSVYADFTPLVRKGYREILREVG